MKTGRKLENLVSELLRQAQSKRDFLTPAKLLHFTCDGLAPALEINMPEEPVSFPLRDTGHQQLAERLEIPKVYYDRMREEAPWLLEENVCDLAEPQREAVSRQDAGRPCAHGPIGPLPGA